MASLLARVRDCLADGVPAVQVEGALLGLYVADFAVRPAAGSRLAGAIGCADAATAARLGDGLDRAPELDEVVARFEAMVPATVAQGAGVVFTPSAVADFMAAEALRRFRTSGGDLSAATVADPAVGCGALLAASLRELVARTGQRPGEVSSRLSGMDVCADSVRRARLLLDATCLELGDASGSRAVLRVGDSLHDHTGGPFDVLLANPPYVRLQDLPPESRARLAERWVSCRGGNFNLYFAFLERARELVADGGVAVFITPNGFLSSKAAGPLRDMLADGWLDGIVDFGHHRVFAASTYTAITVGGPAPSGQVGYVKVAGLGGLAELPDDWAATRAATYTGLSGEPWALVGRGERDAVETIRGAGRPLGEVASIRYGLATLRDRLFLLDGATDADGNFVTAYGGEVFAVEPGATRPVVKVAGATAATLAANRARIVHPYVYDDEGRATVMASDDLAERFPRAYAYLCAVRGELAQRDRGRKTYPAWFAYGRSQGLRPLGDGLVTPLYADVPRFLSTRGVADALMINGCAVAPREGSGVDVDCLRVILNSGVARLFVEATGRALAGGFFSYQKPQLSQLGVPDMSASQRRVLLGAGSPGEADAAVADLYGVTLPAPYLRV